MPTSFPFSESKIKAIQPPKDRDREYHRDTVLPGLQLCVTAAGAKTFYFVKRTDGQPTRHKLGPAAELSVDQARKAAAKKAGKIAAGENPQAERRRKIQEATLGELWESYLERHAKPRKKSWKDDQRMYNKYLADLKAKRLSTITKEAVSKRHGELAKEHGPYQANRVKALLATMFSKASESVGYSGGNPCIGVQNFPEPSRERFLLSAEMSRFFRALAAEDAYWQGFFLLCLFTGARRGNVAAMEWPEVDVDNALWHVPGTKTKNKKPTTISLCEPALAILTTRREQRNGSKWVFPAFVGDGHLSDPRKAWNRILLAMRVCPKCGQVAGQGELINPKAWKRADKKYRCPHCKVDLTEAIETDLRMHDLRRTQGSWQAAMGISLAIIGKSLGHADLKSTQVYSRLQLDPVADAVSRASGAMVVAAGVTIGGAGVVIDATAAKEGGSNGKT